MKIFSGLGGIGEEKLIGNMRKIIGHAQDASGLFDSIIRGSGGQAELHEIKRSTYEEAFSLSNSITSGAIAPNLIADMLQLVRLEYKIVDMVFVAARSFNRYRIRDAAARRYVSGRLAALNRLVGKSLGLLYKMHAVDSLAKIRELRNEIKLIEEEGDEIKEALLSYAYKTSLGFKSFYEIVDLAYLSDDVLDSCEDTADMLMNIMFSIMT